MLRWGIIGCGDVAEHKGGPALQQAPGSALVAAMRRDRALAAAFATRMGVPRYYGAVEELLADPQVDAVYVATPVHLHHAHTLAVAQAGKHVLVEKPMALDAGQAQEMIAACGAAGVALGVAYYRRFYPVVARVRELIEAGAVGRVVQARVQFGSFYQGAPGDGGWRTDPQLAGGGALADIGSHRIDLLLRLLGPIDEVSAFANTLVHGYASEDSASLLLRFASGAHGLFGIYWTMRERVDQLEITGTDGRIVVSELEAGTLELHRPSLPAERQSLPPPRPTHLGLVSEFVQAVAAGRAPAVSGEIGLQTTLVLDAAYRAARERRGVRVGEGFEG
jgi:predicted dehydrogenase